MAGASPQQPADVAPDRAEALPPLAEGTFCPQCNYDLRGLTSNRCPECGLDLTDIRTHESLLPWVHREQIGRSLAYWKTVWLVLRRPDVLVTEIAHPVYYPDVAAFRRRTLGHTAGASVLTAVSVYVWYAGQATWSGMLNWVLGAVLCALLLTSALLPSLSAFGYFTKRRREAACEVRGVALSCYAWSTVALAWVMLPWLVLAYSATGLTEADAAYPWVGALAIWVLAHLDAAMRAAGFARRALRRSWLSMLPRIVAVHVIAVLLVLLGTTLIVGGLFFLTVVWYSLR